MTLETVWPPCIIKEIIFMLLYIITGTVIIKLFILLRITCNILNIKYYPRDNKNARGKGGRRHFWVNLHMKGIPHQYKLEQQRNFWSSTYVKRIQFHTVFRRKKKTIKILCYQPKANNLLNLKYILKRARPSKSGAMMIKTNAANSAYLRTRGGKFSILFL